MSPPHSDFVLSGVSILASHNLDILGVKNNSNLTFKDHVHAIVSVSLDNSYFEVGEMYICVTRCDFTFVLPVLECVFFSGVGVSC